MAGLRPGDEVIVPAITFIATVVYPLALGAKVVLADVDRRTINLDPAEVARKVTPRTRMIVPVHIGGWPVDMAPLMRLARQHDLVVLEDAVPHAFGAEYRGRRLRADHRPLRPTFPRGQEYHGLRRGGTASQQHQVRAAVSQEPFCRSGPVAPDPQLALRRDRHPGHGRGLFVAGNHSATEIQAVALRSQMRRNGIIAARRGTARHPQPAVGHRTRRTGHSDGSRPDARYASLVPTANRPGRRRRQCAGPQGETHRTRCDTDPALRALYKFQLMRQLGYDTAAIECCSSVRGRLHQPLHTRADLRPDARCR